MTDEELLARLRDLGFNLTDTALIVPSDDGYTALIDETELLPVTGFYDEDGCSCSFDDATMAVAGPDANGLFAHIDLDPGTERLN